MKSSEPSFDTLPQAVPVRDLIRCAAAVLPALSLLDPKVSGNQIEALSNAIRAFDECVTESWSINDVPEAFDAKNEIVTELDDEEDDPSECFVLTRSEKADVLFEVSCRPVSDDQWNFIREAARHVAMERRPYVRIHYDLAVRDDSGVDSLLRQSVLVPREDVVRDGLRHAFVKRTGLTKTTGPGSARNLDCMIDEITDRCGEAFVGRMKL